MDRYPNKSIAVIPLQKGKQTKGENTNECIFALILYLCVNQLVIDNFSCTDLNVVHRIFIAVIVLDAG